MRRSYLAALLAAVIALSLIPVAAFASGTPEVTQEQALGLLSTPARALEDTAKETPEAPEAEPSTVQADPTALAGSLSAPERGGASLSASSAAPVALFALSEEEAATPLFADMGDVVLTFAIVPGTPNTITITGCEGTIVGSFTVPQEITVDGATYPVTALDTRVFAEQRQMTQIWLPNTIQTIGLRAFYNCDHLVAACTYDLVDGAAAADRLFALPDDLTSLEMSAFFGCTRLVSVIIPAKLTTISACAFSYCYSLGQNVTDAAGNTYGVYFDAGSRLETIQQEAFSNCISLENITLPESLKTIEMKAFYRCAGQRKSDGSNTGLKSLVLPDGLQTLEEGAFFECMSLERVSLPASLKTIENKAFFSCINLEQVHFRGNGLTSMGVLAFGYCYGLKGLTVEGKAGYTLPSTLTSLPKWAFSNCSSLEDIVLPEGLVTIGEYAFTDSGITAVTFPQSLAYVYLLAFEGCDRLASITWATRPADAPLWLGEKAFASCQGLTAVTLPQLAEGSGSDIFYNCDHLESVTLAAGTTRIPDAAFRDCDRLSNVDLGNSLQSIGQQAFYSCPALTGISLPQGLATIGALAFNRTALAQVTIPASVQAIGRHPFGNNRALQAIYVAPNNVGGYYDKDGVLFRKVRVEDPTTTAYLLCAYPAGKTNVTQYTVPDGIAALDHYAFSGNEALTAILFPDSLKVVGDYAFNGCIRLQRAALPAGVSVGSDPFQGCHMLTQVTLPEDMVTITSDYLPPNSRLTQVTLPASAAQLNEFENPFQYLPYLESILVDAENTAFRAVDGVLYSRDLSVLVAYPPNKAGDTFVVPETVREIRALAFAGNLRLQHIVVPETVQAIGRSAFYDISTTAQVDFYREDAPFGNNKAYSCPFGFPENTVSQLRVNLTHDPNDADGIASYTRDFYTSCGNGNPVPLANIQAGYFKTPSKTGDKFVVDGVIYTLSGEASVTATQNPHYGRESVTIPAAVSCEGAQYAVSGVAANAFAGAGLDRAIVLIDRSLVGTNAFGSAQVTYRTDLTGLQAQETELTYGESLTVTLPADVKDGAQVTLRKGSFTTTAKANGGVASFPVNAPLADALGFDSPALVTLSAGSAEGSATLTLHPKTLTVQDLPRTSSSKPANALRLVKPYDGTNLLDYTDAAVLGTFPAFGDDLALRVTGTLRSADAAPNMFYPVSSPALTLVGGAAKYYAIGSDIDLSTHLLVSVGFGQLYLKEVDGVLQRPTFQRVFATADGMRVADCDLGGGQFVAYLPTLENGVIVGYETVDVSNGRFVYDEVNHYPGLSSFEELGVEENRVYHWHFEPNAQASRSLGLSNYRFYGTVKLWDTSVMKSDDTLVGQAGENPILPAYVDAAVSEAPDETTDVPVSGDPPEAPSDTPPEVETTPGGTGDESESSEPPAESPDVTPSPSQSPDSGDGPSEAPTDDPSESPSDTPTGDPSESPSDTPTGGPTDDPSESPSDTPTGGPTDDPSESPSDTPTGGPSDDPSESPSDTPTGGPSDDPSESPSDTPTGGPSDDPSESPSSTPAPSPSPTVRPTTRPSSRPVVSVVSTPTAAPTDEKVSVSNSAAESAVSAASDGTVTLKPQIGAGKSALISLPVNAISQAVRVKDGKVEQIAVSTPLATVTLSRAALESLVAQADGTSATLRVALQDIPDGAKSVVGSHSAYDLTFKSAKNAEISTFGGALVTVSIPYRLAAGERGENITAVHVKENGETERVPFSSWRDGQLVFETRHLSTYAVAHLPSAFSDSTGHWAAADISYAASRGLLIGVSPQAFHPSGSVSWKMAFTVLGRMDGVEPDPTAAWYDPYLNWAEDNDMLPYAQDPNESIERQEMAKLLAQFLALHGQAPVAGTIPPSSYLDRKAIGARYIADVGYLREVGLMRGHADGTFGPQDYLTRAQFATLLRRLVDWELGWSIR